MSNTIPMKLDLVTVNKKNLHLNACRLVIILFCPIRKYPTDFNNLNSIANKVNVSLVPSHTVKARCYINVSRFFGIIEKKKKFMLQYLTKNVKCW